MKTPTEFDLHELMVHVYDPAKARASYEKRKHVEGRTRGATEQSKPTRTRQQAHQGVKAQQKKELQTRIRTLSGRLDKLERLIRQLEHDAVREDRKGKAKKERAAKEKDKPKSAVEKAKASQELMHRSDSGDNKKYSVSELKSLATKAKGQIAVAKQKLAAL